MALSYDVGHAGLREICGKQKWHDPPL